MDVFKVKDKVVFESVGFKFVEYVNSVHRSILRLLINVELRKYLS